MDPHERAGSNVATAEAISTAIVWTIVTVAAAKRPFIYFKVRGTAMKINRAWVGVSVAVARVGMTPIGVAQSAHSANAPATVNSQASPEARGLLRYLDSISGQYTITGQHNYPNEGSRWTDRTYDLTG